MGLLDVFARYADSAASHKGVHYVPSFNDLNTSANDDAEELETGGGITEQTAPTTVKSASKKSNKLDDAWPAFEGADIHKVNKRDYSSRADHMMDIPKAGQKHSVWEHIIQSEKLKGSSFKQLDAENKGFWDHSDLKRLARGDSSKANQLMAEADINRDGIMTVDEYMAVLERHGSE